MACDVIGDNCPRPGDSDNILLRKILLALTSGDGVAGGNGIVETPGGVVNFAQSGPYTPGAIPFATGPTTMGFDPTQLFWDDVNNRLGVGTDTPSHTFTVRGVPVLGTARFELFDGAGMILDTVIATDARSEFRRLGVRIGFLTWDTGLLRLEGDAALAVGTTLGGTSLFLKTNDVNRWELTTTGHFLAFADNAYDIGATANRPRSIYAGTSVFTPQVQFPAVQVPSADPNNLDDYEEGSWTPVDTSGASLAFTVVAANCKYTKMGRQVTANFALIYPITADGSIALIGGLPFTSTASDGQGGFLNYSTRAVFMSITMQSLSTSFFLFELAGGFTTNAEMSGIEIRGTVIYFV